MDCKRAPDVLHRHPDVHRITSMITFKFSTVLAIECDMPWKEGFVEKYGESFKPWTEEDLTLALGNVIAALPHNQLATIVSLSSYAYFS